MRVPLLCLATWVGMGVMGANLQKTCSSNPAMDQDQNQDNVVSDGGSFSLQCSFSGAEVSLIKGSLSNHGWAMGIVSPSFPPTQSYLLKMRWLFPSGFVPWP